MPDKDTLGQYFVDVHGKIWQHLSYTDLPTISLRSASGEVTDLVLGSPLLQEFQFRPANVQDLTARVEQLEAALRAVQPELAVWPARAGPSLSRLNPPRDA